MRLGNMLWKIVKTVMIVATIPIFLIIHAPIIAAFPSFKEFLDWYNKYHSKY